MSAKSEAVPWDQFYAAIGRATTAWFKLEEGLRDIFTRLVICSIAGTMKNVSFDVMWIVGNIFYSSTNLRARLAMITETMERVVDDPAVLKEWNAAKNRVLTLYKRRNMIAHGAVAGNDAGADFIMSPMFASNWSNMSYVRVCACEHSFNNMAERLTNIAIAANQHLVAKAKRGP